MCPGKFLLSESQVSLSPLCSALPPCTLAKRVAGEHKLYGTCGSSSLGSSSMGSNSGISAGISIGRGSCVEPYILERKSPR